MTLNLAFLASHRGSAMRAAAHAIKDKSVDGTIVAVFSNKPDAPALAFAREHHIPAQLLVDETLLVEALEKARPDLICLSGYLKKIPARLLTADSVPIINIHPSLLPRFGGKGMFGRRVHQAVLAAGDTQTGATLHLVNENYDEGKIIAQAHVAIKNGDTPETLAERVMAAEEKLFVETLRKIALLCQQGLSAGKAIEKIVF